MSPLLLLQSSAALCVAIACLAGCLAQPFQPGQGVLPLGNWRTSDRDGPYNLTLMPVQAREIEGVFASRTGSGSQLPWLQPCQISPLYSTGVACAINHAY